MGLNRRASSRAKHVVKEALRAVGPSPDLIADLGQLREKVEANSAQVDATGRRLEDLVRSLDELVKMVRELPPAALEASPAVHGLDAKVSGLGQLVTGLAEQVHLDHVRLGELEERLDRVAGSIQDEMALERRLERIEDHIVEAQ